MIELIVTIFAGLGFFSMVHFVIHLIEKMNKNIKQSQKGDVDDNKNEIERMHTQLDLFK